MRKLTLPFAITKHIIGDVFLGGIGSIEIHFAFHREDVAFINAFGHIIMNGFHDHRRFLFPDDVDRLTDELFRIVLELIERAFLNAPQDRHD